jgi:hypothetical protein
VINLAPDKPAVFREIARVLKPGGRLAVSNIAMKKPLPPEIGNDLMAYVGCVAGAILIEEYRNWLAAAAFPPSPLPSRPADVCGNWVLSGSSFSPTTKRHELSG